MMTTMESRWNEVEELALYHARKILNTDCILKKDDVEKANQLVYIATTVEVNKARQKANGLQ